MGYEAGGARPVGLSVNMFFGFAHVPDVGVLLTAVWCTAMRLAMGSPHCPTTAGNTKLNQVNSQELVGTLSVQQWCVHVSDPVAWS